MFYFVLEFIFLSCLAVIVFLFLRKLPLVDGFKDESRERKDSIFHSEFVHKIDRLVISFIEKALRKIKLFLMRFDNFVSSHLDSIKNNKNENITNRQNLLNELHENQGGDGVVLEEKDEKEG